MALPSLKRNKVAEFQYSDVDFNFEKNIVTNDIPVLYDVRSINNSLKNIILIDKGEFLMQPLKGAGIRKMLFQNMTPAYAKVVKEAIKDAINTYEKRIVVDEIIFVGAVDDNKISIRISYTPIGRDNKETYEFMVEKLI